MPSVLSKLTPAIPGLRLPTARQPGTLALLLAGAAPLLAWLLTPPLRSVLASYRTYLAIGPGGVPHNFLGFLAQAILRPFARSDTRAVPAPYRRAARGSREGGADADADADAAVAVAAIEDRYAPHGNTSFLSLSTPCPPSSLSTSSSPSPDDDHPLAGREQSLPLPRRRGGRPDVPPFVAPQRQTSMRAGPDAVARMQGFLRALAGANRAALRIGPSALEGVGTDAIFLREPREEGKGGTDGGDSGGDGVGEGDGEGGGVVGVPVPEYMGRAKGEIVHVHCSDGSSHVTVSLVDAEEAIRKGWAERHPLSGVGRILPWGYIMVYAPRDEAEYEVWRRLVVAGCRFVTGGRDIKVVDA